MDTARPSGRVKLIVGLISNDTALFEKARRALEKSFRNRVDFESGTLDFTHTDYYNDEMGPGLKRRFLSFKKPVPLTNVERFKLISNKIEKGFSVKGMRRINIDPGYLDLSKLVLFSTKDYSHRIHLARGIFAEATLFFQNKKFNSWPWTYPDYKTDAYIAIFNFVRELYKDNIAGLSC